MTRNEIALTLARETGKAPRTAWSWYDVGMPDTSLEEARGWVTTHRPPRAKKESTPEPPAAVDAGFDSTASIEDLVRSHPRQVACIITMREAGVAVGKIAASLGFSASLTNRILASHPRAKEIDKASALDDWKSIRRLAASRLRAQLEDPSTKIPAQQLSLIAAIATDKIDAAETIQPGPVSIRQRIEAMSHAEIIRMITTKTEAVIESSRTTTIVRELPGDESTDGALPDKNAIDLQQLPPPPKTPLYPLSAHNFQ